MYSLFKKKLTLLKLVLTIRYSRETGDIVCKFTASTVISEKSTGCCEGVTQPSLLK